MSDGKFKPGNRAAEKYSLEDAITIFRAILHYLEVKPGAFSLGQPLVYFGYYSMLPYYLLEKYSYDDELAELAMRISTITQTRLEEHGAYGVIDKTMAIFLLKAKHQYKEARDTPQEQAPKIQNNTYNIANLPPEKLKELREVRRRMEELTQGTQGDEEQD